MRALLAPYDKTGLIDLAADGGAGNDTIIASAADEVDDTIADSFLLEFSSGMFGEAEFSVNGALLFFTQDTTGTIIVNGSSDDDSLVADFTNGNPVGDGGVQFNGMTHSLNGDSLQLDGGTFDTVTHNFTNANDGAATRHGRFPASKVPCSPHSDVLHHLARCPVR